MNKTKSPAPPARIEDEPVGLRERKAGVTRLALVNALSERLIDKSLSDISADELAEAAGVSRVTFFNYFANKESALEHVLLVWLYERQCDIASRRRRGVAAIEALFRAMGAFVQQAPLRAKQALAWFIASPAQRSLPLLTRAERALIAGKGVTPPTQRSLGEMLQIHLAEARDDGVLMPEGSDYELAHMLGALLIGGCLVGHSKPNQNWERLYVHHVRRTLDLDRDRAAPAPKKPRPRGERSSA